MLSVTRRPGADSRRPRRVCVSVCLRIRHAARVPVWTDGSGWRSAGGGELWGEGAADLSVTYSLPSPWH